MPDNVKQKVLWVTKSDGSSMIGGDLLYSRGLAAALDRNGCIVEILAASERRVLPPKQFASQQPRKVSSGSISLWGKLRSLLSTWPSIASRYDGKWILEAVRQRLPGTKYLVVDSLAMATIPYKLQNELRRQNVLIVYLAHNHEESLRAKAVAARRIGPAKLISWIDAHKAARVERRLVGTSSIVVSITSEDAERFGRAAPETPIVVCPPGLPDTSKDPLPISERPRAVCILGSLHWSVKQDNMLQFLTAISTRLIGAGVDINVIGDGPPEFLQYLASQFTGIKVWGRVGDISAALDSSRIGLIIDEVGGGFKLKLLDYAVCQTPVVALSHAVAGLDKETKDHIVVTENLVEMAELIISLIDNQTALSRMASNFGISVSKTFDWNTSGGTLSDAMRKYYHKSADVMQKEAGHYVPQ